MRRTTAKGKKAYRKAQLVLNHEQRQLKQKSVMRSSSLNTVKDEGERPGHAFNFGVNIQAVLVAFYTGTGWYDIGLVASFL